MPLIPRFLSCPQLGTGQSLQHAGQDGGREGLDLLPWMGTCSWLKRGRLARWEESGPRLGRCHLPGAHGCRLGTGEAVTTLASFLPQTTQFPLQSLIFLVCKLRIKVPTSQDPEGKADLTASHSMGTCERQAALTVGASCFNGGLPPPHGVPTSQADGGHSLFPSAPCC